MALSTKSKTVPGDVSADHRGRRSRPPVPGHARSRWQSRSTATRFSGKLLRKRPGAAPPPKPKKSKWWLYALIAAGVIGTIIIAMLLRKTAGGSPAPAPQPGKPDAPAPRMSNKTVALEAAGDITMGWVMGLTGKYKDVTFKLKRPRRHRHRARLRHRDRGRLYVAPSP